MSRPDKVSINYWRYRMHDCAKHTVQMYENPEFLWDAVSEYIQSAFEKEEAALIVARPENITGIRKSLQSQGVNWEQKLKTGGLIFLDACTTLSKFMHGDNLEEERFRSLLMGLVDEITPRFCGIKIYGEMVDVLWGEGKIEQTVTLEKMWCRLSEVRAFTLLCGYDLNGFHKGCDCMPFASICNTHQHVYPSENYQKYTEDMEKLRLVAELQQTQRALAFESNRIRVSQGEPPLFKKFKLHGFEIDPTRPAVNSQVGEIPFTAGEFRIFYFLCLRAGQLVTRQQIVAAVKEQEFAIDERSVDVHIFNIRKKLGPSRHYLETVRGMGYRIKGADLY